MKWPLLLFVGWLAIFPAPGIAAPPDPPGAGFNRSTSPTSDPPASEPLSSLPPADNTPPPDPLFDSLPHPTLLRQSSDANFQLVLGRLQLDPVRYRKGSQSLVHVVAPSNATSSSKSVNHPVTESIHVSSVRGIPTLHYSIIGPTYRVVIDADGRGPWRIESQRTTPHFAGMGPLGTGIGPVGTGVGSGTIGETVRVIVEQIPQRPITMRIQTGAPERVVQAATWLHLREADRATFDHYLEPIIDELLWPYRLSDLADAAHSQSLRDTLTYNEGETVPDEPTIRGWVEELSSPVRMTRVEADRNLRSLGITLLPRLACLDRSRLDAEQRHRLAEIETKLTPAAEDDVARLSKLIRDDRSYWNLVSARLDWRDRQVVDDRFKQLGIDSPITSQDKSMRVAVGDGPSRR